MAQPVYFVQPERSVWYSSGPRTLNTHKRFDESTDYTMDWSAFLQGSTISSVSKEDSGVSISTITAPTTTTTLLTAVTGTGHTIVTLSLSTGESVEFRLNFVPLDTFRNDYARWGD